MLLAIDIGNSMINFGLFEEDTLLNVYKMRSTLNGTIDEYESRLHLWISSKGLDVTKIKTIIISSVVPPLGDLFVRLCQKVFGVKPLLLGPGLRSGVKLDCDNPKEVGGDIVADVAGALNKYGPRTIIADLGTANKLIFINSEGALNGCVFSPGIEMGKNALARGTSLLTDVNLVKPNRVLGKNTPDCMNSGLIYGTAYSLLGLVEAIEKEVGYPCHHVLTGGLSFLLKDMMKDFIYDENLVLDGLNLIARRKER